MMIMQNTTELAAAFDTTPRTLRKFLRSNASGIEGVGKGARYALPTSKREVAALRRRFDDWNAPKVDDAPVEDTDA